MIPQPSSQNPIVVTANTMKFFDRMLTQFFARHMPDSTQAKPKFMKNTRNAVINTQTVSAAIFTSPTSAPGAGASGSAGFSSAAGAASADGVASAAGSDGGTCARLSARGIAIKNATAI